MTLIPLNINNNNNARYLGECPERGVIEHACSEPYGFLGPHDDHRQQTVEVCEAMVPVASIGCVLHGQTLSIPQIYFCLLSLQCWHRIK
jgi:hypothetical protein